MLCGAHSWRSVIEAAVCILQGIPMGDLKKSVSSGTGANNRSRDTRSLLLKSIN